MQPLSRPLHPIGTPTHGARFNTGPLASAAWLAALELVPSDPRWFVEVLFDAADARFHLEIYAEEWGYRFHHGGKSSWIRVTDIPFVHGHDEHELLRHTPKLRDIGRLVETLRQRFEVGLADQPPAIRTNLLGAEAVIAEWARTLTS